MPDTTARALALWEHLARAGAQGPLTVSAVPDSLLCPPGWCGIVHLDGTTLATAPTADLADTLRAVLARTRPAEHTDPEVLRDALPATDVLGPATLAYLARDDFRPRPAPGLNRRSAADPAVEALLEKAGPEEAGESGLAELEIPLFTLTEKGAVIAAAGYEVLPEEVAHLCVLTDPEQRGRGLARAVASAAVAHALDQGLLPQWRARPAPSRRVAAALGFRELGAQLSLQLG
ncbi:GNAT family N-acetyltransferase [Nocardiopsis ganjiahuensis]|uniref:GNAT family N-acetyltransferase n=1 Tax=Nocardiopsis ganjiahuensis TaxID=239984 RepID=UPI000348235C|nr:GNAT family N-acetyltransferase [Nocardiopsis ganjiahuensis]